MLLTKPHTTQDAECLVTHLAKLASLLGCSVALRDQDVLAAQTRYATAIEQLSREISAGKAALEVWANANRAKEFPGGKTLDLPHGVLSFRTGNRALELLPTPGNSKERTWKDVLGAMKGFWKTYLRPKVEIDKAAILKASNGDKPTLKPAQLARIGVHVVQTESFSVELRAVPATLEGRKSEGGGQKTEVGRQRSRGSSDLRSPISDIQV